MQNRLLEFVLPHEDISGGTERAAARDGISAEQQLRPSEWNPSLECQDGDRMTSFVELRRQRHALWLAELQQRINALVSTQSGSRVAPDQIYLFVSRARGDWDGLSDTDLLVVAASRAEDENWADTLLDHGLAQDVIALDRNAWSQLPEHPSVIWRHVARDAQPLLSLQP